MLAAAPLHKKRINRNQCRGGVEPVMIWLRLRRIGCIFFLLGKSEIPRSTRYALVIGVPIVYLLVAVLLLLTVS